MKYAVILLLFFSLYACTKEVKIDIPGYEEKLVVDGSIETGMPAIVLLSRTKDIYSPTNIDAYLSGFINDATVIISDGTMTDTLAIVCTDNLPPGTEDFAAAAFGIPVDQLSSMHLCGYVSTHIVGEVGKTYTLKVLYNSKTYTSSTSILQPTPLDSVYWRAENETEYGYSWAHLSDPPGQYDAYSWQVKKPGSFKFYRTFNSYVDDDFFNGLSFEFGYENPMNEDDTTIAEGYRGYYHLGDTVILKFSKLGKKEFEFFEKKYNQIYSAGNPFATPTNIPTNIEGGALGIWIGYSPWYDTLICGQ